MATTMSPPAPPSSSPLTPASKPLLPRSQAPRPSPPTVSRAAPIPLSIPDADSSASSSSSYTSFSTLPLITPATSSPNFVQPIASYPISGAGVQRKAGMSTATTSSSINGLSSPGMAAPTILQTGASKMAAAAKRGQAGLDGGPRRSTSEEEEHPLSEKSLKARDYQTIHTLNRLFHLPSRWSLLRPLGQGAYGLVISVQDNLSGEPVAVKCITRVFDKVILARRALREITLLRHFGGHENLTGLIDLDNVWYGYNEIYLYMEPMEADLHQIVRSGQPLSNSHIQYFLYQLLRGIKFIHSANVIHRDLKPGNLLVNSDCELKICDFGLARGFRPAKGEEDQNEAMRLTEYVATRWYRAPEVMLSNRRYTTAIDVWSIGCILAELLGGKPIFKGKDFVDQLNLILEVLGTPDDNTLARTGSEKACGYIRTLPLSKGIELSDLLSADPDALDLLSHLLKFDPTTRIDVPTALTHAYVSTYHDESDEPFCPRTFDKWEEVESLETIEELRIAITREIAEFRAEVRTVSQEEEYVVEQEDGEEKTITMVNPVPKTGLSPRSGYFDLGISPQTSTAPLAPSRDRERESTPPTPMTALSEDSFGNPLSGRTSRRTSGQMPIIRRPNSCLFASPLGAGMTPMPSQTIMLSESGGSWNGRRSRAASGTGEFASLRPLIRQLSTVGLDGKAAIGGDGSETDEDVLPPMIVSPSDAPPSAGPKNFG